MSVEASRLPPLAPTRPRGRGASGVGLALLLLGWPLCALAGSVLREPPRWSGHAQTRGCAEARAYLEERARTRAPLEPMVLLANEFVSSDLQGEHGFHSDELRCRGDARGIPVRGMGSLHVGARGALQQGAPSAFLLVPSGREYQVERACLGCAQVDTEPPSTRTEARAMLLVGLALLCAGLYATAKARLTRGEGARSLLHLGEAPSGVYGEVPAGVALLRLSSKLEVRTEGASFVGGRWVSGLREGAPQLCVPASGGYRDAASELPFFVGPGFVNELVVRAGQRAPLLPGDRVRPAGVAAGQGVTVEALCRADGVALEGSRKLLRYHLDERGQPALLRGEARWEARSVAALSVAVLLGAGFLASVGLGAGGLPRWLPWAAWLALLAALPPRGTRWRRVSLELEAGNFLSVFREHHGSYLYVHSATTAASKRVEELPERDAEGALRPLRGALEAEQHALAALFSEA